MRNDWDTKQEKKRDSSLGRTKVMAKSIQAWRCEAVATAKKKQKMETA
jgi:hypothetical protein